MSKMSSKMAKTSSKSSTSAKITTFSNEDSIEDDDDSGHDRVRQVQSDFRAMDSVESGPGSVAKEDNIHLIRQRLQSVRTETQYSKTSLRIHKVIRCPVLHPEKNHRMIWDLALLWVILYCAIMVPVDLGMQVLHGEPWESVDMVILIFFSVDIILNFNTAFYNEYGNLEQRRYYIAVKYIKTWFFLDFCSTFPFDVVLMNSETKGTMLMRLPRIVKMLRLIRLMRVARIQSILKRLFGLLLVTNMAIVFCVKFISLFVALLLVCHWLACGFCAIAPWEENDDIANDVYGGERRFGWSYDGVNAMDISPSNRYQASMYFTFCAILMIKPTDIGFNTIYCRYFMIGVGFIKPIVAASIMGVLTNMIVKDNTKRGALQMKKQALGAFLQEKKVATEVQHQVLAYLEHGEQQMQTLADIDAIASLSPTLQEEVAYHTLAPVINTFRFFEVGFGKSFVRQLCSILKFELFGPDDVVCQEGHYISRMVFVNSGSVKLFRTVGAGSELSSTQEMSSCLQYLTNDRKQANVLNEGEMLAGDSFGAQSLLVSRGGYSYFTAICFVFCELVFLTRPNFLAIVDRSPSWQRIMKKVDRALTRTTDQKTLVDAFARGDVALMDEVLERSSSAVGSSKKIYFGGILRRAVNEIQRMKEVLKVGGKKDVGQHFASTRSSTASSEEHAPTSGFQTLKMTTAERCVLQELATIRENLQSSLNEVANRVDHSSKQLEKRIGGLDERMDSMNSRMSQIEHVISQKAVKESTSTTPSKPESKVGHIQHESQYHVMRHEL